MIIKQFNNLEEIQEYYDRSTNTYVFKENGSYIDLVVFEFNLETDSSIDAWDIKAWNIKAHEIFSRDINAAVINAHNIYARNIIAWSIIAENISYNAVCFAREDIKCKSICSLIPNAKHFVLKEKIKIEKEEQ